MPVRAGHLDGLAQQRVRQRDFWEHQCVDAHLLLLARRDALILFCRHAGVRADSGAEPPSTSTRTRARSQELVLPRPESIYGTLLPPNTQVSIFSSLVWGGPTH
eukprot:scaffold10687_cov121-Isochrysis_galbana.AAC.1